MSEMNRMPVGADIVRQMPDLPEKFHADEGILIARDNRLDLYVRAGSGSGTGIGSRAGSVLLMLDRKLLLADPGVGFTDGAGETICARPEAIPARDTRCGITADDAELSMEYAAVYGDPRIRSVRRRVKLCRGTAAADGSVLISDDFHTEAACTPILTFLTGEKPEIVQAADAPEIGGVFNGACPEAFGPVTVIRIGDAGYLTAAGVCDCSVEDCPADDGRSVFAPGKDGYRIFLTVKDNLSRIVITPGKQSGS